jgi:uncharacterized membrane protein
MNVIGILALLAVFIAGVAFMVFRRMRLIGFLLLVSAVTFVGYQWTKESKWRNQFQAVPTGAPLDVVIAMVGEPSVISDSAHSPFGYSLSDSDKRIISEAWYVSFFFPEQYTFGFDNQGKLLRRYRYVSP